MSTSNRWHFEEPPAEPSHAQLPRLRRRRGHAKEEKEAAAAQKKGMLLAFSIFLISPFFSIFLSISQRQGAQDTGREIH